MPMDTTKYNHRHQSFYQTYRPPYFWTRYRFSLLLQNIGLHTSGQDIDSLYFCKISASHTSGQTSGQDMTSSSEVHDKGDPLSKLKSLLEKFISIVMFKINGITTDSQTFYI